MQFRARPFAVIAASVVSIVLLGAPVAGAEDATSLFNDGRAAAKSGNYLVARQKFEAAFKLDPAPGTLLNLADCDEHLGHILEAVKSYRLAAAAFPAKDPRRPYAVKKVAETEKKIAHLSLSLPADLPADATVVRDGAVLPRATAADSVEVDPGPHEAKIVAPGHKEAPATVVLGEGESKTLSLALGPAEVAVSTTVEPPKNVYGDVRSPPGNFQKTAAYGAIGVGAAGIVLGAVTGVVALSSASTYKEGKDSGDCVVPAGGTAARCASSRYVDAYNRAGTFATVSTIAWIAGAVVGAGGVVLLVTAPRGDAPSKTGSSRTLGVTPVVGPGLAGASFSGSF
jgi:hypothetical protein